MQWKSEQSYKCPSQNLTRSPRVTLAIVLACFTNIQKVEATGSSKTFIYTYQQPSTQKKIPRPQCYVKYSHVPYVR
jgi:hypothetical protein